MVAQRRANENGIAERANGNAIARGTLKVCSAVPLSTVPCHS